MIYTGPTLRAFQIPLAHSGGQTESMCGWPLYGPCVISEHVEIGLLATAPALTYSYRQVRGIF